MKSQFFAITGILVLAILTSSFAHAATLGKIDKVGEMFAAMNKLPLDKVEKYKKATEALRNKKGIMLEDESIAYIDEGFVHIIRSPRSSELNYTFEAPKDSAGFTYFKPATAKPKEVNMPAVIDTEMMIGGQKRKVVSVTFDFLTPQGQIRNVNEFRWEQKTGRLVSSKSTDLKNAKEINTTITAEGDYVTVIKSKDQVEKSIYTALPKDTVVRNVSAGPGGKSLRMKTESPKTQRQGAIDVALEETPASVKGVTTALNVK